MTIALVVWLPSCYFISIVIYYLNFILNHRLWFSVVNQNFLWDISEYVMSKKDNLALAFVRNSPMNIPSQYWQWVSIAMTDLLPLRTRTISRRCGEYNVSYCKQQHTCMVYVHVKLFIWTNIGSQYVHSVYKVQSASRGLGRW
jgi:hypothetical protein